MSSILGMNANQSRRERAAKAAKARQQQGQPDAAMAPAANSTPVSKKRTLAEAAELVHAQRGAQRQRTEPASANPNTIRVNRRLEESVRFKDDKNSAQSHCMS